MAAKKDDDRFARLEKGQRETNRRLGRIEDTLGTASKIFELMHERLEHLEAGQDKLVEGQQARVEGQPALAGAVDRVVERLDRLVEISMRDRTGWADRYGSLEARVDRLEASVFPDEPR